MKTQIQGLRITIKQLAELKDELIKESHDVDYDRVYQVDIINQKGLSDTWELLDTSSTKSVKELDREAGQSHKKNEEIADEIANRLIGSKDPQQQEMKGLWDKDYAKTNKEVRT